MFNQFSIIFTIYYLVLVIHIYQYNHFYDLFFDIYQPKLVSFFLNRSCVHVVTIMEVLNYFTNSTVKSHATKLMNFTDLPELFQHVRTAIKNPKHYYHISQPKQGYDALSFDPNNLQKIVTEKNTDSVIFYEKKMTKSLKVTNNKISSFFKKYSLPKTNGDGIRPDSVDQLEVGFYSTESHNNAVNNIDLSIYNKPSIILEDYSNIYAKIVFSSKHAGLGHGTLINNFAFEELKWFYNLLENNDEMCLYLNNLLENNPNFPIII